MSGASRKVKNPLLSAATVGCPFENYGENVLLMPVKPATPALLPDDAELDSFVGQDPVETKDPPTTEASLNLEVSSSTLTPTPKSDEYQQQKQISGGQQAKQGYFTSILSSLPNLSLSSIKGDQNAGPYAPLDPNIIAHNQGTHVYPQAANASEASEFSTVNLHDSRKAKPPGSGDSKLGPPPPAFAPPAQPSLPPTAPISSGGSVSYRLGNQRRLKYAPPPDLTSNTAREHSTPPVQNFLSPRTSHTPPTIFNPNVPLETTQSNSPVVEPQLGAGSPSSQSVVSEQISRNESLQGSFRSSPIASGHPQSYTPQAHNPYYEHPFVSGPTDFTPSSFKAIPPRVREPATPQNTPANVSFPGFIPYTSQQDSQLTPIFDKEGISFASRSGTSTPPVGTKRIVPEVNTGVPFIPGVVETTFTPICAAEVTEKLEHLLAERKEHPSSGPSVSDTPPEIVNVAKTVSSNSDPQNLIQQEQYQQQQQQSTAPPIKDSSEAVCVETTETSKLLKSDSLSDVFLGEDPLQAAKPALPEQSIINENISASSSVSLATSNLRSSQHYQSQAAQPLPPVSDFFVENKPEQRSDLNYVAPSSAVIPANSFADLAKLQEKTPSAFFQPVDTSTTHSLTHWTDTQEANPSSYFNQPPVVITSGGFNNSNPLKYNTAPNLWSPDQSQNLGPSYSLGDNNVTPAPTFYNPSQFNCNPYEGPSPEKTFNSSITQAGISTASHFFANASESQRNYGSVFSSPCVSMATAVSEPTGIATLSPVQMLVNPLTGRSTPDTVPPSLQNLAGATADRKMPYRSVYHHWFHRKEMENKILWIPFSMHDSLKLEDVHNSSDITPETIVATDGGRYDVDILRRKRSPVYWAGASTEVRRCSWFYKGPTESRYVPYEENTAVKLEEEYKQACLTNIWNRRIDLNNGEYITFHSASVQVHYLQATSPDAAGSWTTSTGSEDSTYFQGGGNRPRVVKRGVDEFNIDDGEPERVDHLLFLVHGIGSVCDLKFRSVEEVVDEFRSISLQLVQSHYRTASEHGIVHRIEVLPISWHATLHSGDTGIDKKLQAITLESIPKLRHFTNDTLLDILFYTSPIYCQTIMQTVGNEMNRLYALFKERNPSFGGGVYLGGHSLGSLILFDLLCHQKPLTDENTSDDEEAEANNELSNEDNVGPMKPLPVPILKRRLSKRISYVMGAAGTGQPYIHYPQLHFHPRAFFALGSPIGMFVTVRGIDTLGEDFALPTCPAFFNVFHPFDPVAYRVESLITPDAQKYRPMLIPHHKGRKRMHLELKETMARVGADLKQKLLDSVRNTWNSVYQLALFHKPDNQILEREIDKVVEEQMQQAPSVTVQQHNNDDGGADFKVGNLNGGRRIDYVLQEAPFEYINEYIFALTSHVCYWESEDTMLMILKEIYGSMGIQTDAQYPQQTLSIERASPSVLMSPSTSCTNGIGSVLPPMGVDPTAPISGKLIGPPPKTGFIRKT